MPASERKSFWDAYFFEWFPGETLGVLRAYFGIGLIVYLATQYPQVLMLDTFGREFYYTIPIWYFDLLGIDHNIPWLNVLMFLAMVGSCLLFAAGKWTKPAIIAVMLCIFYLKGVRDSFSGDVHHREVPIIAILLLFLASKCDEVFGMDARKRPPKSLEPWEASWPIRAMQTYVAFFYFWALVAKLRVSGLNWFAGGGRIQDILIERAVRDGFDVTGRPVNLSLSYSLAQQPHLVWTFGAAVFAFEIGILAILFVRDWRIRAAMLVCATAFHLSNYLLLNVQFYMYPIVFMIFFNMAEVHKWLGARLVLRRSTAPVAALP